MTYSRFVTESPWVVIGIDLLLVFTTGPVAIWYAGLPDFSDPNKGFEPRGTSIHGWNEATTRLMARLLNENGSLSYFPPQSVPTSSLAEALRLDGATTEKRRRRRRRRRKKRNAQECLAEKLEGVAQRIIAAAVIKASVEGPPTAIPRMVVETVDKTNLWAARHMSDICEIEKAYIRTSWDDGCPAFSLPYYIGALRDKDCSDIHDRDMDAVFSLLRRCSKYYFAKSLTDSCYDASNNTTNCPNVPSECTTYNAPYNIYHYFTDVDFLKNGDTSKKFLTYSTIIYRKSCNYNEDGMLEHFLKDIEQYRFDITSGEVVVRAMDYYIIFNPLSRYYVLSDLPFYGLAMVLVILVLLFYLRSPALMLAVMLNVGLSLFSAYFLYHVIFQFKYFTFVNLLACLLLIAVGADDVFILHDIWEKRKLETEYELTIAEINSYTLQHGVLSILVTSLTTAAALLANAVSDVTALKCFGIFGGICILVNFFFMITLVPAILVISERYSRNHPDKCSNDVTKRIVEKLTTMSQKLWREKMPVFLLKPRLIWLVVFVAIGTAGLLVVFYKPALGLPNSERTQVFYSAHPFEVYRSEMLDEFHFEIDNKINSQVNMQLQFPFGIQGKENGNVLDPNDRGTLKYDNGFEIYSQKSQQWMKKFCSKLLDDKYVVSPERYKCFYDVVKDLVESNVSYYSEFNITIPPECYNNEFPLPQSDAKVCYNSHAFVRLVPMVIASSNYSQVGTPIYKRNNGKLVAMTHQIETDFVWTARFPKMDAYYKYFESFMLDVLKDAPRGVDSGWFAGAYGDEFFYYDLQIAMAEGTISGIALSMTVGFLVMLCTSGNILITIYSMVTIALVIAVTVCSLVLMGWELQVLEALVITLAVGLSIDFTIHLAVAYKVSPHSDRRSRAEDAIATVGSAVTMAGLTTFLSGVAITLGRVMTYYKFGIFLILDMTVSWAFSLFFFIPLCSFIGPEGKVGELKALADKCLQRCTCENKVGVGEKSGTDIFDEEIKPCQSSEANEYCPNSSMPNTEVQKPRTDAASPNGEQYVVGNNQDFSASKLFTIDDTHTERCMYYPDKPIFQTDQEAWACSALPESQKTFIGTVEKGNSVDKRRPQSAPTSRAVCSGHDVSSHVICKLERLVTRKQMFNKRNSVGPIGDHTAYSSPGWNDPELALKLVHNRRQLRCSDSDMVENHMPQRRLTYLLHMSWNLLQTYPKNGKHMKNTWHLKELNANERTHM